jgi:hypothetical protein
MARRASASQTELPGTEKPADPEIDRAAEEYRTLCAERMAMQVKEEIARDTLLSIVKKRIEAGDMSAPSPGETLVVYSYVDDEGTTRHVKFTSKEVIKVNKGKGGAGGSSDDDE